MSENQSLSPLMILHIVSPYWSQVAPQGMKLSTSVILTVMKCLSTQDSCPLYYYLHGVPGYVCKIIHVDIWIGVS